MTKGSSISPCLGCTERTIEPNCHTNCIEYKEAMAKRAESKEALRKIGKEYDFRISSKRYRRGTCGLDRSRGGLDRREKTKQR